MKLGKIIDIKRLREEIKGIIDERNMREVAGGGYARGSLSMVMEGLPLCDDGTMDIFYALEDAVQEIICPGKDPRR